MATRAASLALLASLAGLTIAFAACTPFGATDVPSPAPIDAGSGGDGGGPLGVEDGSAPVVDDDAGTATIRCGSVMCSAPEKCCLPYEKDDPACKSLKAPCGTNVGELRCSDPSACETSAVCCLTAERKKGQSGFVIARTFCTRPSECVDGEKQHVACLLGSTKQCAPGKSCKPYLEDSDGDRTLDVDTKGYATCQ
jgi:hypothetical protein